MGATDASVCGFHSECGQPGHGWGDADIFLGR